MVRVLAPAMLALAFAGCLGDGDGGAAPSEPDAATPPPGDVHVSPSAGRDVGTIEGVVRDEAGAPFAGARVALRAANATGTASVAEAVSGDDGAFRFDDVPRGAYKLEASAPGRETAVAPVTVRGGEVARAELILPALITDLPFNVTAVYQGRVTCWAGVPFFQYECEGSEGLFAAAGRPRANDFLFGAGPNASQPVAGRVVEVWVEATWSDVKADIFYLYPPFGMTLTLAPANEPDRSVFTGSVNAGTVRGDDDPPARVVADAAILEDWAMLDGGEFLFRMEPTANAGLVVAVDIAYEAHATVFYNGPADPCWSPLWGAAAPC